RATSDHCGHHLSPYTTLFRFSHRNRPAGPPPEPPGDRCPLSPTPRPHSTSAAATARRRARPRLRSASSAPAASAVSRSAHDASRSEEHTSELQSRENLVCRLLL